MTLPILSAGIAFCCDVCEEAWAAPDMQRVPMPPECGAPCRRADTATMRRYHMVNASSGPDYDRLSDR